MFICATAPAIPSSIGVSMRPLSIVSERSLTQGHHDLRSNAVDTDVFASKLGSYTFAESYHCML